MREIKFRGKRIDNNEWIYGSLIIEPNLPGFRCIYSDARNSGKSKYLIYPIDAKDGRAKEVIPKTIGEYVGRKDDNNKEMYEGDITKNDNGVLLTVEWDSELCMFLQVIRSTVGKILDKFDFRFNSKKVVGNIHDNPELLKEKK